ncbi:alpha-amylase family glycosyl hydrolase [Dactylosporangium sp. NPDC049525]|uniref:alpha-amylase family glycosyl hydrolase n=1 Tax=Dactylosporangium sp. NPDC049525 TaxID=3154730 RepID=UPI0034314634
MDLRSVADIDFRALTDRVFHPSPAAWEDEVLYFLLVDRFSDGQERGYRDNLGATVPDGATPPLLPGDHGNAVGTEDEAAAWRAAGGDWVGGTLAGLRTKLGYLRRLGVTAVWVSPILRQVPAAGTYHGYGTHDFLAVDPHFGTGDDLRELVDEAHRLGIRVVLDVVLNHAGDVFAYEPDVVPDWNGRPYPVRGFRDIPGGAVRPVELQRAGTFTGKGRIVDWDRFPEYVEGDFEELKDIHLGTGSPDEYRPSPALIALTRAYQYWIAYADLDGFRVDTVKHMDQGAARYFASAIHEFAQSIGKERFYLIAEITGDRAFAVRTLQSTGMDAALGIADVQDRLEWTVKGARNPAEYFALFRNSLQVGVDSHAWFRDRVVTGYDDHDQVRKGPAKARFAADDAGQRLALAALALNATTLGIPCVYYGSEQLFDGRFGGEGFAGVNLDDLPGHDRYIREAMFGGDFGPFRSRGRHAFDETQPVYVELAKILTLRRRVPALRRGRQYLREISGDGIGFGLPQLWGRAEPGTLRSVVPWSRIFADHEVLLAINTDLSGPLTVWVTVDDGLHAAGATLTCRYSTDAGAIGQTVTVEARNGKAVLLTVPAAGFVVYAATD